MLLDPGTEQRAVDGSLNGERSDESPRSQRAEEGRGLPTPARSLFHQPRAQRRATVAARHVRFGPSFINKHDLAGIDSLLRSTPQSTLLRDIGTILFFGHQRLFFRDCSSA